MLFFVLSKYYYVTKLLFISLDHLVHYCSILNSFLFVSANPAFTLSTPTLCHHSHKAKLLIVLLNDLRSLNKYLCSFLKVQTSWKISSGVIKNFEPQFFFWFALSRSADVVLSNTYMYNQAIHILSTSSNNPPTEYLLSTRTLQTFCLLTVHEGV